ncbi:hypothetical protein AB6A40_000462 [Gnathostoma spinigerum]|uniref:Uncharacterized protein n=1 Tax=Gnathostoma spinigerum TaxID=75299 RepID=A0ABD6EAI0_9BILA
MKLKYQRTLLEQQDGAAKIVDIDWTPNGVKLAVATAERTIILFDNKGQRRDKFATKPIEPKYGKKSYSIKAIKFSPDSSRLAIGQTDNIAFVYRLGESWDEKKVICNKFPQSSAVTALIWPTEDHLIIGSADGKVRIASCRINRCSTMYKTDVFVTSLAAEPNGQRFVSGHADGSVILYSFENMTQSKIFTHLCPPFALVFTLNGIIAAGCDQRIVSYSTANGVHLQQFDYSKDPNEKEFTVAVRDFVGQNVAVGSYDRLRLFTWNQRRGAFEESKPLTIEYIYTVSALAWSPDGATIAMGTLCGAVMSIDCCLKRTILRGRIETTFIAPFHVIVHDKGNDTKISLRSSHQYPIEDIKVMGHNRFVVAYTPNSLLLADVSSGLVSEIPWQSAGNEKFNFENENVCLVINAGEISVVEYGHDGVLGWIRTDLISPHLISVRICPQRKPHEMAVKRIAYLLDANTIAITDLTTNTPLPHISHSVAIDWLELSESGRKLLYRDRRVCLSLADIATGVTFNLLNYCSYAQWVPNSDVIVAQSGDQLCVWYQADNPEQVTMVPINGDIENVIRDELRTEVIVEEVNAKVAYELDQTLIEFATAVRNLDFGRAVEFLENRGGDTEALWRQLSQIALENQRLLIAQRCFAALGDISQVRFLSETILLADEARSRTGEDGMNDYKVQARLALMRRDFKEAERILLEKNALDEAIRMYQEIHKWDEALELARAQNHPDLESLYSQYYRSLLNSGQNAKAAELRERDGDLKTAISLYLKGGLSSSAARILLANPNLTSDDDLVEKVTSALISTGLFEKAGDLFEQNKEFEKALEAYRKGKSYAKAIQLARKNFPEQVVKLEEEWGDSLVADLNYSAAINHFVESGKSEKALDAAIKAKQWDRATQLADVISDTEVAKQYYGQIAEHHAKSGNFERAEMLYIEAGMQREVINMYNAAKRWQDSHRLTAEFLGKEESAQMYGQLAVQMEEEGNWKDAEQLYISIGQPNKAIAMYKKIGDTAAMMALVEKYHSEHVQDTYKHLASEFEERGDFKSAEEQYLKAKDWKAAVNMYRAAEKWADAYRIAKQEGGESVQKQVLFLWAKSMGGDSAVKLLQKFNLLDESIDFACDNGAFDFAFELCRLGAKSRLPSVHLKLALQLEEEGQLENAEKHYLEAGKAREAIDMYMRENDWESAERIAKQHCAEALMDIYIGRAREAIEQKDFHSGERYLLRANRADIILRYYKDLEMWPDAIRIARDYLPTLFPQVQEEYDQFQLRSGAKGVESLLVQARTWETQADYGRAIQSYLKISERNDCDTNTAVTTLKKAGELAVKFLAEHEADDVIDEAGERLLHLQKYEDAGELFLFANRPDNAVKAYILAEQWGKAKKIANELVPEMAALVDEQYKESLKSAGRVDKLFDVDVVSAIDMLVERGRWEEALDAARQQKHPLLTDKYMALYAADLISRNQYLDAIKAFEKYGVSANPNNFNMYKKIIWQVVNAPNANKSEAYELWSHLRDMLLILNGNLDDGGVPNDAKEEFKRYLDVAHYGAVRCSLMNYQKPEISLIRMKICISMLRYCDLLAADRAMYEAGHACREVGGIYECFAFVFFNHYLDLCDAVQEEDPSLVDGSVFEGTDIPVEVTLPEKSFTPDEGIEDVREWVLAASMERRMERKLPVDEKGNFEGSLVEVDGTVHPACIISGYPVKGNSRTFGTSEKVADADCWNTFMMAQKTKPSASIDDVLAFIARWTKSPLPLAF